MARNLRAHAQIAAQPFCAAGQSWQRERGRGRAAASCWQMSCHREARRSWKVCHLHSSHLELLYEAAAAAASELSLPSTCHDWFIISLNYYQRGERRGGCHNSRAKLINNQNKSIHAPKAKMCQNVASCSSKLQLQHFRCSKRKRFQHFRVAFSHLIYIWNWKGPRNRKRNPNRNSNRNRNWNPKTELARKKITAKSQPKYKLKAKPKPNSKAGNFQAVGHENCKTNRATLSSSCCCCCCCLSRYGFGAQSERPPDKEINGRSGRCMLPVAGVNSPFPGSQGSQAGEMSNSPWQHNNSNNNNRNCTWRCP